MVRGMMFGAIGSGVLAGCALSACTSAAVRPHSTACAAPAPATPFDPKEFKTFRLINSRFESHDTRRFVFALESEDTDFYLPLTSCIVAKFKDGENDVVRPYTPVTANGTKGHFELVVKRYSKSKMGTHLFQMRPGETMEFKGPFTKFKYQPNAYKHIGLVAGGTGITPMYQLIQSILRDDSDKTKLNLIYANTQRKDILLATELCELQKTHDQFHMYLTLSDPPKKWLGGVGFVTETMLKAFLPKPGEDKTMVLVCGPSPMMKAISGDKQYQDGKPPAQGELDGALKAMGYTSNQVYKF